MPAKRKTRERSPEMTMALATETLPAKIEEMNAKKLLVDTASSARDVLHVEKNPFDKADWDSQYREQTIKMKIRTLETGLSHQIG